MEINVEVLEPFEALYEPKRFKVFYGGRGAAKSWAIAEYLIICALQGERILCTREVQNSIQESVHKLLEDTIYRLGLEHMFDIQKQKIFAPNGGEFIFMGLEHNKAKIKSMEGVTRCWLEECDSISKVSLDFLIPTMREAGSEILFSFNPNRVSDAVYKRFIVPNRYELDEHGVFEDDRHYIRKVSWRDNPYFTKELNDERLALQVSDKVLYNHIWEGNLNMSNTGIVYDAQIKDMRKDERIGKFPYNPAHPVKVIFDIGIADSVAMLFVQTVQGQNRIIDDYEANGEQIAHYVKVMRDKPYVYADVPLILPHDSRQRKFGMETRVDEQFEQLGFESHVLPIGRIVDGISDTRTFLSVCLINETKCKRLIECLEHYHYPYDEKKEAFGREPVHDWSSHMADAMRYVGVGYVAEAIRDVNEEHRWNQEIDDYDPNGDFL